MFIVRRVVAALAVVFFIGICAAGAVFLDLREYARTPAGDSEQARIVVVEAGTNLTATAASLHREGLIRNPFKFRLLARLCRYDRTLKAGEYSLRPSMTPLEILVVIEKGLVLLHRLTIPEGLTIIQIADLVAKAALGGKFDFINWATDPDVSSRYGVRSSTLEGYLFPETYYFPMGTPPDQIIAAMLQRFRALFSPQWEQRAAELGMTVHEIVTLASIIEKETSEPSERPLISSVFHNRLRRGMRLETDPTVIYGIKNFDGNLTRKHLETPNPYNTYLIKGLPPGPIANPGKEALEAALYPARTDYLFFVSRNNGTHHFSTSLSDHHRAVQHYQTGLGRPLPISP
jgi:UPF0755 protein